MAHKLGAGSTRNSRDSESKRLGIKSIGHQKIKSGTIIVRQRGTKLRPGVNVGHGKDHTLYALKDGFVHYSSTIISIINKNKNLNLNLTKESL